MFLQLAPPHSNFHSQGICKLAPPPTTPEDSPTPRATSTSSAPILHLSAVLLPPPIDRTITATSAPKVPRVLPLPKDVHQIAPPPKPSPLCPLQTCQQGRAEPRAGNESRRPEVRQYRAGSADNGTGGGRKYEVRGSGDVCRCREYRRGERDVSVAGEGCYCINTHRVLSGPHRRNSSSQITMTTDR